MNRWLWILPVSFISLLVVTALISWFTVSYKTFPRTVRPGSTYPVGDKTYTVPQLPHKQWKSNQTPSMERPIPILGEQILQDMNELARDLFLALEDANVSAWVAGGTLISAVLWKHLMPFDDDIDLAVDWKHREFLFSPAFATVLDKYNLEPFVLRWASLNRANKDAAAVRVRRKGTTTPTADLFFSKSIDDVQCGTVKSWNGDKVEYFDIETWPQDWIFPVQKIEMDGMVWPLPAQPHKCLDQHYGEKWKTTIQSPPALTRTHQWAFWITNMANVWRVIKSDD
jgi:hypothetical protein